MTIHFKHTINLVSVLFLLLIALGTSSTSHAQLCGAPCGKGNTVDIDFYGSGGNSYAGSSQDMQSIMTLNGVTVTSYVVSGSVLAITPIGTVTVEDDKVYTATLSFQQSMSSSCVNMSSVFFAMKNGCRKTLQIFSGNQWIDASAATTDVAYLTNNTFTVNLRVVKRLDESPMEPLGENLTKPPEVVAESLPELTSEELPQVNPATVTAIIPLGGTATSGGLNVGSLSLSGPITSNLASLSNLRASGIIDNSFEIIEDASNVRQVKNANRLGDVMPVPNGGFEIRFFNSPNFGSTLINGVYPVYSQPSSTVTYAPIAAVSGEHFGGIRIATNITGQAAKVTDTLATNSEGNSWCTINYIDNKEIEKRNFTSVYFKENGQLYRTDLEESRKDGYLVSKTLKTYLYQYRISGSVVVEKNEFLASETIYSSESIATTTTWLPDPDRIGKIKSIMRPDGSWEAYTYYHGNESLINGDPIDSYPIWAGRLKQILRPYNGLPLDPSQATVANSISTRILYDPPTNSTSVSQGIKENRRTTFLPGGLTVINDSERVPAIANATVLVSALSNAGIDNSWLPHIEDITSEQVSEHASGNEKITNTLFAYATSHIAQSNWIGKTFALIDSEGKGTVTGYQLGHFNNATGAFTPNNLANSPNSWGSDLCSTTVNVVSFGLSPANGEATRKTNISDHFGNTLKSELSIKNNSGSWITATTTTYEYNYLDAESNIKEIIAKKDGRLISRSVSSPLGPDNLTTVWDETGIETRTLTDGTGRIKKVTRVGIDAAENRQAQTDQVTTYNYDGLSTTTVVIAGELSRTQKTTYDLTGRITSETDPSGAIINTSYNDIDRSTTTIYPGGLTKIVKTDSEDRIISVTGSAVLDEIYNYEYSTSAANSGNLITTHRIGDTLSSPRFQSTETDWAGRNINVRSPSPTGVTGEISTSTFVYYQNTRRCIRQQTPKGTLLIQKSDPSSETIYWGYDLDNSNSLELASADRITEKSEKYIFESNFWWLVTTKKNYDIVGSSSSAITSISKTCLYGAPDGFASKKITISPSGEITTITEAIDRSSKSVTQTTTSSIISGALIKIISNGWLISKKSPGNDTATRYEYNSLGEVIKETTPLGVSLQKSYYTDGSLRSSQNLNGGEETYEYYGPAHASSGKISVVTNSLGEIKSYAYSNLGSVTEINGNSTYRLLYEYDVYGMAKRMLTWQNSSNSAQTEWNYQDGTGLLESKTDANGNTVSFSYNASGDIRERKWARTPLITTTYSYQNPGDLIGIDYSDATPDVAYSSLDRLGRPTVISQMGVGSEIINFHPGSSSQYENYYDASHALLPGVGIRSGLPDEGGRPSGFQETSNSSMTVQRTVDYGYDTQGRLDSITDGDNKYIYQYKPNSNLVYTIDNQQNDVTWFKQSRFYDSRERLVGIRAERANENSLSHKISIYSYKFDQLGRRARATFQDGSFLNYEYNSKSEIISSTRKNKNGEEIVQLSSNYSYDEIGNRSLITSPALGDHQYTVDDSNQFNSITSGPSLIALGRAPVAWNVEINGEQASRSADLYYKSVVADNSSLPVWKEVVTRRDTGTPSSTRHLWYSSTPFSPTYDNDGNLLNDGRWEYTWDGENRLIKVESTSGALSAGHPYTKIIYQYDWQGRRLARHVWKGGTSISPTFMTSTRWLYNGWNVISEFSSPSETSVNLTRSTIYTWGLDLSNSLQGNGGVGGLLVQTSAINGIKQAASYDGNGNIVTWTKSSEDYPTSIREYDCYGNALITEGNWPSNFGFSTKMQDSESGLIYFGYRWYSPNDGRWLNRDPMGENGGVNLYAYVANNPINATDYLGLRMPVTPSSNVRGPGGILLVQPSNPQVVAPSNPVIVQPTSPLVAAPGAAALAELAPPAISLVALGYMTWELGVESVELEASLRKLDEIENVSTLLRRRIEEEQRRRNQRMLVYRYAVCSQSNFPPGTWVTPSGGLSWSQAISLSYITDASLLSCICEFRFFVPLNAVVWSPLPVMGHRQGTLTIYATPSSSKTIINPYK